MSPSRLIFLSALAGILFGTSILYVIRSLESNNGLTAAVTQGANICPAHAEKLALIDPFIKGDVASMLPAETQQNVSDLIFKGPEGEDKTLADFTGKTVLLNLWATWCAPCREEMPWLDTLQAELGSDEFEVVAVNIDRGDDEKPKAFLNEIAVENLGYYRDETTGIFNEMRRRNLAVGLPVTMLIDNQGCVLAHMNGPANWSGDDAFNLIKAAISKPEL